MHTKIPVHLAVFLPLGPSPPITPMAIHKAQGILLAAPEYLPFQELHKGKQSLEKLSFSTLLTITGAAPQSTRGLVLSACVPYSWL